MPLYFLLVSLGISAFWVMYQLFFKHKTAATTNRSFLMAGLVVPFLLPFISLPVATVSAVEPVLLPVVNLGSNFYPSPTKGSFSWAWWLYGCGVFIWAGYYLRGLWPLLKILKLANKIKEHPSVYEIPQNGMPFSFAGRIFIPSGLTSCQRKTVLEHEMWHVQCHHSTDVIWALAVHATLWFLPIMPFYLKDLKTEHEFEVDEKMLRKHAFSAYAETLLQLSLKPIQAASVHSFSSPNLKKRIQMMTTPKRNRWYKLLWATPVMAGLLFMNACSESSADAEIPPAPKTISMAKVDIPPLFPACENLETNEDQHRCFQQKMQLFVVENFHYPQVAKTENLSGRIYVGFIIDYNGEVQNINLKKGFAGDSEGAKALNKEALRIFEKMPKLKAAQKDGLPVNVEYVMPIRLALPEKLPED